MLKKINKVIAMIAIVAVMTTSALTIIVSADSSLRPTGHTSVPSYWSYYVDSVYKPDMTYYGYVQGLVEGLNTGIKFQCQTYNDGGYTGFCAWGEISDSRLRLGGIYSGAKLDSAIKESTDLFSNDWYELNNYNSTVYYKIYSNNYTLNANQYVTGYSIGFVG